MKRDNWRFEALARAKIVRQEEEIKTMPKLKFNPDKMMNLIYRDAFLQFIYKKMTGCEKAKIIFNTYVLGDSVMERRYKEILNS